MNPNQVTYVPILKAKHAEKKALQLIKKAVSECITPLFEIVEINKKKGHDLTSHLATSLDRDFRHAVYRPGRYYLDVREISSEGEQGAREAFRKARYLGIPFVPVTGISRKEDVGPALHHRQHGIAIRLFSEDFEDQSSHLSKRIIHFCEANGITPDSTDLIIDLRSIEGMIEEGSTRKAQRFIDQIPSVDDWRELILSSSAFPLSMGVVEKDSSCSIDRIDWTTWLRISGPERNRTPRVPLYSDCGIQHPKGVEDFDPEKMSVSASIRYSCADTWLLIKGESTKKTLASQQIPWLAGKLTRGDLADRFFGLDHCEGCRRIAEASKHKGNYAHAQTWRMIGTIHHVTLVVEQLRQQT